MSGNPTTFAVCTPTMPILRGLIDDFVTANNLTKSNKGAVPARETKRDNLWAGLGSERGCVQILCDANPEQADSIATSAGMQLKQHSSPDQKILTGVLTTTKGSVALKASLKLLIAMLPSVKGQGGKRTILWRYTLDGGKTFVNADSTPFITTVISGLPLGTDVGFEVALKDRRGTTNWSQTFTLHVY